MNKKTLIVLALATGLALCPVTLVAEEAPAEPAEAPASPATSPVGAPEPVWLASSSCSAEWDCPDGSTISCSCPGAGSCTSGSNFVDCDCTGTEDDVYRECESCDFSQCSDGLSCNSNAECGTCCGAPCFCVEQGSKPTTKSCICL